MSREQVNRICAALPGAEWSEPFGPGIEVWKLGGRIFVAMGTGNDLISVKTDSIETATMLIEVGIGIKAPYFHRSWVALPPSAPADELEHRIRQSYAIIRANLTKKAQAALPPLG
ncbi:MAG: MmcQ/YjbR family DNA-binding protein [Paracoccus sp. (in: a-proteobacteria)]|nr:MmcQ/YjbR family DNA-binding protein [Paracoccus sp. (in: a-proteobacteria)]